MLQSMIMNVCVRCVFIVTTKCKAMRNIHLEEQDDQETSNLFYIFLYYLLYISGPASTIKEKLFFLVNMTPKDFYKKIILVRRQCWYHILFNKKSKIYFVLLYQISFNKTTFYFFSSIGRREVTVIGYIPI